MDARIPPTILCPFKPSISPIGVTSTMSATATLNGPADADTFRYDRPSDASGDITFTATGMTPPPNLQVFAAFGNAPPSGGA